MFPSHDTLAYKKNDNAHIEQKNWTLIRQFLGYQRIESPEAVEKMNRLYRNEFTMFQNNFIPSVKLIQKNRIGSKIVKQYDVAKTPYQRVQESEHIDNKTKQTLRIMKAGMNPFKLNKRIHEQIRDILSFSV